MDNEKAQTTVPLSMADLIHGPLQAAYEAQARLAAATASFIEQVGFTPAPGGASCATPKTVDFHFDRPAAGQNAGPDGLVPTETVHLTVPLLALVKIPNLAISSIDFSFEAVPPQAGAQHAGESDASLAPNAVSHRYHMQVHAQQAETPEALTRVLALMTGAISPQTPTLQKPSLD